MNVYTPVLSQNKWYFNRVITTTEGKQKTNGYFYKEGGELTLCNFSKNNPCFTMYYQYSYEGKLDVDECYIEIYKDIDNVEIKVYFPKYKNEVYIYALGILQNFYNE